MEVLCLCKLYLKLTIPSTWEGYSFPKGKMSNQVCYLPLLYEISFLSVGRPNSQLQAVFSVYKWQLGPHNIKHPVPPLWVTLHSPGQGGNRGRAVSFGENAGSSGGIWLLILWGRGRGEVVASTLSMWWKEGLEWDFRSFQWSSVFTLGSHKTVRWFLTTFTWWMVAAVNFQSCCRYPHM